jgi:hypothetical protein
MHALTWLKLLDFNPVGLGLLSMFNERVRHSTQALAYDPIIENVNRFVCTSACLTRHRFA